MKAGKLLSSLKNGDPQAVAIACILFFTLSVCWFSYTLLFPPEPEGLPVGGGRARTPAPTPTPLSEFIDLQQRLKIEDRAPNPFFRQPPRERPTRPPEVRPTVVVTRPTPVPVPPTPTPTPETVTYVFKGMIRRPDGESVALVTNAKTGTSIYVKGGDELPPLKVLSVRPDSLEAQLRNDPPILLPRNSPQTFPVSP